MNNKNILAHKYKYEVDKIYGELTNNIPKMENWNFNQSVIFEENKKIICKAVTDKQNKKIGNKISIFFYDDIPYLHELVILDNIISSTKVYKNKNSEVREIKSVTINDDFLERNCIYKDDNSVFEFKETCNLNTNLETFYTNVDGLDFSISRELDEILEDIKSISKLKKTNKLKTR